MRYLFTISFLLIATSSFAVLTKTYTICEGGGCDYTTVAAAEAAHEQDLVANDSALTFEIQNTWASAETQWTVFGWTVDATRFLTITAVGAARATGTWSTTAYRVFPTGSSNSVSLRDYVTLDGIQIETNQTGSAAVRIISVFSSENYTIKNCFLKGNTGTDIRGIQGTSNTSTTSVIRNCIIIDCATVGIQDPVSDGGLKIDNNTIENCGTGIITATNDMIVRNTILWNNTTPLSGNFNTTTLSEENYTDAGSLSYGSCGSCGTGDQVSQSDPFVSIAGEDYHLKSGATAIDAGKDLSADFTDDIDGDTRDANFDKGADEFVSVAVTVTTLEGVTFEGVTIE